MTTRLGSSGRSHDSHVGKFWFRGISNRSLRVCTTLIIVSGNTGASGSGYYQCALAVRRATAAHVHYRYGTNIFSLCASRRGDRALFATATSFATRGMSRGRNRV